MSDIQKYTKFRPVLTLEQLQYIAHLCTNILDERDLYELRMKEQLRKVVVPMIAKVETGAISPAYKLSQTHQLKQEQLSRQRAYESGHMTPEQEAAYEAEILGDL